MPTDAGVERGGTEGAIALDDEHRLLTLSVCEHIAHGASLRGHLAQRHDWERVVRLAAWHRLSGMLYTTLTRSQGENATPEEAIAVLRDAYLRTVARNLHLRAHARQVVSTLAAADVRAVLLKGMALVESVYADPGVRPMADVDVLVAEADADRAYQALVTCGYAPASRHASAETQRRWRESHHHLAPLRDPASTCSVELHRRLTERVDGTGTLARAYVPDGGTGLVPAREDLLLHVCVHFFDNRRYGSAQALGQLADVAATISGGVRWELLVGEAWAQRVAKATFVPLYLAHELLCAPVPAEVLDELRPDSWTSGLARRFVENRILRSRQWLSLELLSPRKHPLRRLAASPVYVRERYTGTDASRVSVVRAYAGRFARAASLVAGGLRRPLSVLGDRQLNSWMRLADDASSPPVRPDPGEELR